MVRYAFRLPTAMFLSLSLGRGADLHTGPRISAFSLLLT